MDPKSTKIHQLKGKSKQNVASHTHLNLNHKKSQKLLEISQNLPAIQRHYSKPILIRYIDPRLVPIFKEFNSLTTRCQQIAKQNKQSPSTPHQKQIEELLQSSKKIEQQFHEIIDESQPNLVETFKETLNNSNMPANNVKQQSHEEIVKVKSEENLLQILSVQNMNLKQSLLKQQRRYSQLQQQNYQLKCKMAEMQKQKKQMVLNIKSELYKLKGQNSNSNKQ